MTAILVLLVAMSVQPQDSGLEEVTKNLVEIGFDLRSCNVHARRDKAKTKLGEFVKKNVQPFMPQKLREFLSADSGTISHIVFEYDRAMKKDATHTFPKGTSTYFSEDAFWGCFLMLSYSLDLDDLAKLLENERRENDLLKGRLCRVISWKITNEPKLAELQPSSYSEAVRRIVSFVTGEQSLYAKIEAIIVLQKLSDLGALGVLSNEEIDQLKSVVKQTHKEYLSKSETDRGEIRKSLESIQFSTRPIDFEITEERKLSPVEFEIDEGSESTWEKILRKMPDQRPTSRLVLLMEVLSCCYTAACVVFFFFVRRILSKYEHCTTKICVFAFGPLILACHLMSVRFSRCISHRQ